MESAPDSGLTAGELAAALAELAPMLAGARVRDAARLKDQDDLLLFLEHPDGNRALHLAPGGRRARVTLTRRRFRAAEFRTGPLMDRLRQALVGCAVRAVAPPHGERRCTFELVTGEPITGEQVTGEQVTGEQITGGGELLRLEVELFGARGLWCLVGGDGRIRELSRLPNSAGRDLRPGAVYAPPPPRDRAAAEPPPRFPPPVLESIDRAYTGLDQQDETDRLRARLQGAIDRGMRRLQQRIDGLERQQQEAARVDEIRRQADLLLAYGFGAAPGATELSVPDPEDGSRSIRIELDPARPVPVQADRLYKKARKLADGAATAAALRDRAEAELQVLAECAGDLSGCAGLAELQALADRLAGLGLQPPRPQAAPPPKADPAKQRKRLTKGLNLRVFTSVEGYPILVGRNNHDNDRLSISVARGNDLWFHVGQGYAGSHVVLRLPKEKSASLESMLDAGTLAVHFSKARNAERCEVLYTLAKNVRKPKGLPPGKVTTTHTKTLLVRLEAGRLRRLLDSGGESGPGSG